MNPKSWIGWSFFVLFCFGCGTHTPQSYDSDQKANAVHASAATFSRGPFPNVFVLSADFQLPKIESNRGWYTNWFILKEGSGFGGPFLQIGLIRDNAIHDSSLRPYIAGRNGAGPFYYKSFNAITSATHRLSIIGSAKKLTFSVDRKLIAIVDRTKAFPAGSERLYLQIAHEVETPGDHADGTISNIRLSQDGAVAQPLTDLDCFNFHQGLKLHRIHDGFTAIGIFDKNASEETREDKWGDCFRWYPWVWFRGSVTNFNSGR
jgi:hypothetical protein